ncbi:AcrR family transcriptional regulator [Thermocatellispora tengchongensis]|uniref:AcrR family transcriptional regulator n=1 Tax=Thermocatellispora tengchongensis TaxID=1073253 RepID=A0A840NU39_9ACTN|nr:TetR family transcriptional regulator [Thermocatellispora tengchongensis]MBB5130772.1 AcrR family transcriptional regulator [Thermocatellispora tengchongensis]
MARRSSAETKATILAAARERFAAEGYDRATIRAIAADAAIDPSMVMRYFGNKEGLFTAAADFDLRLPDVAALPRDQVGTTLARHFLLRWEEDEGMMVLLRTAVTSEVAVERMRQIMAEQLAPVVRRLVPDPEEAALRMGLVITQILGMALCRYVLRLPPVAALTHDQIVTWLGPTLQRYLTA